jgi:Chaperone of endosialidase
MKNRNTRLTTLLLAAVCIVIAPAIHARQQSEDRGNGNSAAEGVDALNLSTTGSNNTAHGWFSLFSNTSGSSNTADGFQALYSNTTGNNNVANGFSALLNNTTGNGNTATGRGALFANTTGFSNTANGAQALTSNTTGGDNTANGYLALSLNTIGSNNTASGFQALVSNTTGAGNTAVGVGALVRNTTGGENSALGANAGFDVITASNVICIGSLGANVSNTTWIENIYGVPTQSGTTAPVIVSDSGQLGTIASSERFKKNINAMEKASEVILSLRPVTFHYKRDAKGTPQFGLIAEEVAKVNPALVLPDKEGKPYTVRYDAVNAMLLNEFQRAPESPALGEAG